MAVKIKMVVIVLLISLSLAVIIQNTSPVEAKILFLAISVPLTLLMGGSLIVGYLLGLLTPVLWRRRLEGSAHPASDKKSGAAADKVRSEPQGPAT